MTSDQGLAKYVLCAWMDRHLRGERQPHGWTMGGKGKWEGRTATWEDIGREATATWEDVGRGSVRGEVATWEDIGGEGTGT